MITVSRSFHAVSLAWPAGQRPADAAFDAVLAFGFLLARGESVSSEVLAGRIVQHYDVSNPKTGAAVRALTNQANKEGVPR